MNVDFVRLLYKIVPPCGNVNIYDLINASVLKSFLCMIDIFILHINDLIRPTWRCVFLSMCHCNAKSCFVKVTCSSLVDLRSKNSSAVFWDGAEGGAYQALLLDEDRGWLLVGGRDHIYMLNSDSLAQPARKVR